MTRPTAFAVSTLPSSPHSLSSSFLRPCRLSTNHSNLTKPTTIHHPIRCTVPTPNPSQNNHSQPQQSPPSRSLASLHELTERIADLLQVGSIHKNHLHCPKDAPLGYLSATTHVAVVFGKHLIRDQVTVEYAKRVVTLVKQIASAALDPHVICFTGGKGLHNENSITEAAAGYALFRNLCEEANIDVSRFQFILEDTSRNTKGNLRNVIDELRARSGADAVSACHFTLVSSDYHLIRIQEVHRLSPRQSILFPLEVSNATWNCIFAAYPFCVSRDPATAFLGRAVVLANDLGIVLVNLNGALDDREFISKENLHRLNETFAKMTEMYRVIDSRTSSLGGFRRDMRTHAETLELAIHDIREVQTLLSPLNETGGSIPQAHLELARELLVSTITKMRSSMDPDRVLRVHDRMAIIDDMISFVSDLDSREAGPGSNPPDDPSDPPSEDGEDEDVDLFSDETDAVLLDEKNNRPKKRRQTRKKPTSFVASEVTWRGGTIFKGNGKKITRDGPHLVIADSTAPPPPSSNQRRSQPGRRTVANSDTLAGSLATALTSNQPPSQFALPTTAPRATRTRSAPLRKTRPTPSSKKRKPATRKLARHRTNEST